LRVERVPLPSLQPASFNPRRIERTRLEALKRSMETDPLMLEARPLIALPDGTVVCGNQRLLAAVELGWTDIPTVVVDLDAETARLWMLRDNNAYGEWEEDALGELLLELQTAEADLELAGFTDGALDALLRLATETAGVDDVPPLPEGAPESKLGELYELGEHRLLCGDATDPDQVELLLAGEEPVLLVTDPPYGVELELEWRDRAGRNKLGAEPSYLRSEGHRNTSLSGDTRADWSEAFALVPSLMVAYVWHADRFTLEVGEGLRRIGFQLAQLIVWDKQRFVLSRTHYHSEHEPCWYARKPASPNWLGSKDQSTVWRAPSPKMLMSGNEPGDGRVDHPTQKPVSLFTRPLENHLRRGGCFYEPFAGSGTALIAAEITGRRCLAIELDPRYCDVIRQRFEAFAA
jgi:DNA modification methylase